jgi:predicted RNase H-like HicB family nuclease
VKRKTFLVPIVILKTRTGYSAFSPVFDGCAVTDKTIDRTLYRMRDALELHIECLAKKVLKTTPQKVLKKSFDDYGTEALYATLKIAA